jgi:lia operon protein LiaG
MRTALLAALTAAALPSLLVAQAQGSYTLSGDNVAVYNLVGKLQVEPGTGAAVTVQVTPGGANAGQLKVEQGGVRGRDALRVVYPGDRIRYAELGEGSRTTLRVQEDGTFGDDEPRGRRVTISGGGTGVEAWADLRVTVPAGRYLTLRLAVGSVTLTNVDGHIDVGVMSGPIKATGERGVLKVGTGSGDVEVTRFQGDRLALDTGSGDVAASGVNARRLGIETGSGDVRLSDLEVPDAVVETGSGKVTVDLKADVESLRIATGSGDVAVSAPPSLGAAVNIETGSGEIDSEFPLTITRTGSDHVTGTVGDGKGRISVETGSGSVRLARRGGS